MKTVDLIKAHIYETQPIAPTRGYLGMSGIGHDCGRKLWYDFRFITFPHFPAETLLMFADGHNSEDITADRIRSAMPDIEFMTHKDDGEQFGFADVFGHFRGHCDGIGSGFPEFGNEWAIWEHKCSDRVKVNKLVRLADKHGEGAALAEWNYTYYIQAILYMYYGGVAHHLLTVSHSGSRDYVQICTEADTHQAEQWITQARHVITSDRPLDRFREDPDYYQCKWCDHRDVCHGYEAPEATCRSCLHLSPVVSGEDGLWICHKHGHNPSTADQITACDDHIYIPDLLSNWADITDTTDAGVVYSNRLNGSQFTNGKNTCDYSSKEIKACAGKELIGNEDIQDIKNTYDAKISDGD